MLGFKGWGLQMVAGGEWLPERWAPPASRFFQHRLLGHHATVFILSYLTLDTSHLVPPWRNGLILIT